jgi:hypothetical protein
MLKYSLVPYSNNGKAFGKIFEATMIRIICT